MASRAPTISFATPASRAAQRRGFYAAAARAHAAAQQKAHDCQRGNSAARGYGSRWRVVRAHWLAQHPLCAHCEARGDYVPATLVDHITPVTSRDDPLFYDVDNWQSLCRACHALKTREDARAGLTRSTRKSYAGGDPHAPEGKN